MIIRTSFGSQLLVCSEQFRKGTGSLGSFIARPVFIVHRLCSDGFWCCEILRRHAGLLFPGLRHTSSHVGGPLLLLLQLGSTREHPRHWWELYRGHFCYRVELEEKSAMGLGIGSWPVRAMHGHVLPAQGGSRRSRPPQQPTCARCRGKLPPAPPPPPILRHGRHGQGSGLDRSANRDQARRGHRSSSDAGSLRVSATGLHSLLGVRKYPAGGGGEAAVTLLAVACQAKSAVGSDRNCQAR